MERILNRWLTCVVSLFFFVESSTAQSSPLSSPPIVSTDEQLAATLRMIERLDGDYVVQRDPRTGERRGVLLLDNTQITDADLAELKHLPHLTELYLQSTEITDHGLAALAQLPHLTTLLLCDTEVTDAGMAKLAALQQLTTLGSMDIHLGAFRGFVG